MASMDSGQPRRVAVAPPGAYNESTLLPRTLTNCMRAKWLPYGRPRCSLTRKTAQRCTAELGMLFARVFVTRPVLLLPALRTDGVESAWLISHPAWRFLFTFL